MPRVFLLWLSALLPSLLCAHAQWQEASALGVIDDQGRLCGIFTDGDLRRLDDGLFLDVFGQQRQKPAAKGARR